MTKMRQYVEHGISIHALREEGDVGEKVNKISTLISIHALREEGDHQCASQYKPAR